MTGHSTTNQPPPQENNEMPTEFLLEETDTAPSTRDRARSLALDALITRIKDEDLRDKNWKIARYDKRSSASGAASALKGKFGEDATCAGFTFGVSEENPEQTKGKGPFVLIARYEPDKIVAGNLEKSVARYKAKEAEAQARYKAAKEQKERDAKAAANAQTVPGGEPSGVPSPETPEPSSNPANPSAPASVKARKTA